MPVTPVVDGSEPCTAGDHAAPRASLTLKLRENLALYGERYKRFARIAGC
jgi:hypothetical protein